MPYAFTKKLYNTKQMDNSSFNLSLDIIFFFIHLALCKSWFFIFIHPVFSITGERITPVALELSIEGT